MSQGLAERDERAGEVEEAEGVGADSFPAHEQPAEAVVPGVGPLHDPSARLAWTQPRSGCSPMRLMCGVIRRARTAASASV